MDDFQPLHGDKGTTTVEGQGKEQALSATVFSAISGIFSKGAAKIHPGGGEITAKYRVLEEVGNTAAPLHVVTKPREGTSLLSSENVDITEKKRKLLSFPEDKERLELSSTDILAGHHKGGCKGCAELEAWKLYERCKALACSADASEISATLQAAVAAVHSSSETELDSMLSMAVLGIDEKKDDPWAWFLLTHVLCSSKRAADHFVSTVGFRKVLQANGKLTKSMPWGLGDFGQVLVEEQQQTKEWAPNAIFNEDDQFMDKETPLSTFTRTSQSESLAHGSSGEVSERNNGRKAAHVLQGGHSEEQKFSIPAAESACETVSVGNIGGGYDGDLFVNVGGKEQEEGQDVEEDADEDEDEEEDEDEDDGVGPEGALLQSSSSGIELDDGEAPVPPLQLKLLYSQSPKRISIGAGSEFVGVSKSGTSGTPTPMTLAHAVKMRDRLSQAMGSSRAERLGPFSSRSGRRHLLRSLSFSHGTSRGGSESQRSSSRGASARAISSRGTHARAQSLHGPSNFSARRSIRSGRANASSPVRSKSARVGVTTKSVRFKAAGGAPMAPFPLAQHKQQFSAGSAEGVVTQAGILRSSPPMTPQTPMTPGTLAPALLFEDAGSRLHEVAERLGEAFLANELWAFAAVRRRQRWTRSVVERGLDSETEPTSELETKTKGKGENMCVREMSPVPRVLLDKERDQEGCRSSGRREEIFKNAMHIFDGIRLMHQGKNEAGSIQVCDALQACVSATEVDTKRLVSKLAATLLIKTIVHIKDEFHKVSSKGAGNTNLALASSTAPRHNPCGVLIQDVVGLSAKQWLSGRNVSG